MTPEHILAERPTATPVLSLIWTAVVDIAPRHELGDTPQGTRFMVPILGGRFFGGPGFEEFSGHVLPGGADRQLLDQNGFKTLDALYEMQTASGEILTIRNRVKVDQAVGPEPYRFSVIEVIAPVGELEWMNRRVFLGTLESARPSREAVIVRGWSILTS